MGPRYVIFRAGYEVQRKLGLLKRKFPTEAKLGKYISKEEWKNQSAQFFFDSSLQVGHPKVRDTNLEVEYKNYKNGVLRYFNALDIDIPSDRNWVTNPDSGYKYDISKHWTEISDIVKEAGDIKFVWERSRFSFLYTLIRYDYHFNIDSAKDVFHEIEHWIDNNPINKGPNYKCSQEISLRVLNWTFALHYYKNSSVLNEKLFEKILHSIYWQIDHVHKNIQFSLIAVRNNHAITESLMLYVGGMLFPSFLQSNQWRKEGKRYLEKEIAYQIYEDGTHLLLSTNYQRTVLQVLTWAVKLAAQNGDEFSDLFYQRIYKSINQLYQVVDLDNGNVPNYGPNDGSLFCKLNNKDFRDYRPQINALAHFLTGKHLFVSNELQEDAHWYNNKTVRNNLFPAFNQNQLNAFEDGGLYTIRDKDDFTFLVCKSHRNRPMHADNLHLDIWWKGYNVFRDAGTYKYNTSEENISFFNGTRSHNTIGLGNFDQMQKGPRFIWLDWSHAVVAEVVEKDEYFILKGKAHVFKHVDNNIFHTREVKKIRNLSKWLVNDILTDKGDMDMIQYWNINPIFFNNISIEAYDSKGNYLEAKISNGYFSNKFGVKENTKIISFKTKERGIKTEIKIQ